MIPRSIRYTVSSLLLLLCGAFQSWAGAADPIALGDAAYQRKSYDSAVSYYKQASLVKQAPAVVFFKLGNAHYRLRHVGEAMLAYERALLRQPAFPAAAHNAQLIQKQVSPAARNEVFFLKWWQGLTAPSLTNFWAVLAIVLVAGLLGFLGWRQFARKQGHVKPQIIGMTLMIALLCAVFSFAGAKRYQPGKVAVVMRPDAKFQSSAQANGSTGISLPEGLMVDVIGRGSKGLIVRLADGQEGFVQVGDVSVVD